MSKKIIAVVLLCSMLLSLGGCGASDADKPADGSVSNSTETVTIAEPTIDDMLGKVRAELPVKDYGGHTFTILDRSPEANPNWETRDAFSAEQSGDPINDAVYERNQILEENFNIKIAENKVKVPADTALKLILAGDDTFDLVTDGLSALSSKLATQNYLIDFKTVSGMNLSKDYWDQSMNSGLSVANKLYYTTGDVSIMDNYGTWCMMFNKDYVTNYKLENPYELVENGKWTLEKFHEMAADTTSDLNGDGKFDKDDQYGFISEGFNTYGLWLGSGEKITSKDENDLLYLSVMNDRSSAVVDLVIKLQSDKSTTFTCDMHPEGTTGTNAMFSDGKAFAIFGGMRLISGYRDSEVNFGIVPTPKFEEAQEKYYNTYSYINCTAYGIPVTAVNSERTGVIFDAMAALSQYTLTPSYIDVSLKGKYLRDNESEAMIDIVLSNRSYDLAAIFDWGGTFSMFNQMYSEKKSDFASRYAKIESKAQAAIDKYIESIEA